MKPDTMKPEPMKPEPMKPDTVEIKMLKTAEAEHPDGTRQVYGPAGRTVTVPDYIAGQLIDKKAAEPEKAAPRKKGKENGRHK